MYQSSHLIICLSLTHQHLISISACCYVQQGYSSNEILEDRILKQILYTMGVFNLDFRIIVFNNFSRKIACSGPMQNSLTSKEILNRLGSLQKNGLLNLHKQIHQLLLKNCELEQQNQPDIQVGQENLQIQPNNPQNDAQCPECGNSHSPNCTVEYAEIPCPYCGDPVIRSFLKDHLEGDCLPYVEQMFKQLDCKDECVICFDEIGTTELSVLGCAHKFHKACITDWFKKKSHCPICRK